MVVNNPNTTPLRIQATGGLEKVNSSGANIKTSLDVTVPGLVMGLSGSVAAPAGMSADMIKVYLNRDAVFTQTLTGTAAVGSEAKNTTISSVGASGPSAAVIRCRTGRCFIDFSQVWLITCSSIPRTNHSQRWWIWRNHSLANGGKHSSCYAVWFERK